MNGPSSQTRSRVAGSLEGTNRARRRLGFSLRASRRKASYRLRRLPRASEAVKPMISCRVTIIGRDQETGIPSLSLGRIERPPRIGRVAGESFADKGFHRQLIRVGEGRTQRGCGRLPAPRSGESGTPPRWKSWWASKSAAASSNWT